MSAYGTEEFKELWRRRGFFVAVETITPTDKATPADFRRLNATVMRDAAVKLRKEIARMQAAVDRIEHELQTGVAGGKMNQVHLEPNIVEVGGWIASTLQSFGGLGFYLSEAGFRKVEGWLKEQSGDSVHPSRLPY